MSEPVPPEFIQSKIIPPRESVQRPPFKESPDDRNRMVSRLKHVSTAVSDAYIEQSKGAEQNPFNLQAGRLIQLGNGYITYLEAHSKEITDPKIFQAIAILAKISLLMNIEQYAVTIRGIGDYVSQHPQLNDLNPPGKIDGPWANIKETLYFTKNNDVREQFRERVLNKAQLLITAGEFNPREVDHLERFLVDSQGRLPSEFVPEYVTQHAADIQRWLPLNFEDFQRFTVEKLANFQGEISESTFLKRLDEEIASIKPKNIQESKTLSKTKYEDREKNLPLFVILDLEEQMFMR
jgi:hypothetical protein